MKKEIVVCWLRRDLRLNDNTALFHALKSGYPVLIVFIFDTLILDKLPSPRDARVHFIYEVLQQLQLTIRSHHSSIYLGYGTPEDCFSTICDQFHVKTVYANHDYEPYAIERDSRIRELLEKNGAVLHTYKDQVIFEKSEILKPDGKPYTVFTPYANRWKQMYRDQPHHDAPSEAHLDQLLPHQPFPFPSLESMGFEKVKTIPLQPHIDENIIRHYEETRNIPGVDGTSRLSPYLRFGIVSVRQMVRLAERLNVQWLNELIWREFFMMILYHFPHVVHHGFKKKYDAIPWRNNEKEFDAWCKGETGYPLVDAGMRQLNETGWMHNRVRMVVASFLTKHLLIDWRWGEAYFAGKLMDYELSSNNGNWQWAAGSGCDAAPYFRIFNPAEQLRKFDPGLKYVTTWVQSFHPNYIQPIVDHDTARRRALDVYKKALEGFTKAG
jgi:deoxyribodipyrimidine photo-lyase